MNNSLSWFKLTARNFEPVRIHDLFCDLGPDFVLRSYFMNPRRTFEGRFLFLHFLVRYLVMILTDFLGFS